MRLRRTTLFTSCLVAGVSLLSLSAMLNSCKSKTSGTYEPTGDTIADGKALVQQNCTRCHALVPVNALTKDVWITHTLPAMAKYFHISTYGIDYFKNETDTAGLSLTDWQTIVSYYKKAAPDSLTPAKRPVEPVNDWAGFTLRKAAPTPDICFTTLATQNPATGKIYTSDVASSKFVEWNAQLTPVKAITLPSPVVDLNFQPDSAGLKKAIASCIGRLDPIDFPNGRLFNLSLGNDIASAQIASDLPRPVQTISVDVDKDGSNEVVICGQGNLKGGVYLLKYDAAAKTYKQTTITERPGAVYAEAADFNKDGYTDLMVLFGSTDEGLALYLNDKKGGFTPRGLLKFPPVYGSTSFQLADLDKDGDLDLIYTCGYNFKDSRILKPYHGLYIYKNEGNFKFKQDWFYPINGCTKAVAADFDRDGDLDIATIAFFADMKNNPSEEFIYFVQDGAMKFKPHTVPVSKNGRWMTMSVADVNRDGAPDILLGNYASGFLFQPNFEPQWDEHTPFIVLENHIKK